METYVPVSIVGTWIPSDSFGGGAGAIRVKSYNASFFLMLGGGGGGGGGAGPWISPPSLDL